MIGHGSGLTWQTPWLPAIEFRIVQRPTISSRHADRLSMQTPSPHNARQRRSARGSPLPLLPDKEGPPTMPTSPQFAQRVYDIVAQIPPGRVTTYGTSAAPWATFAARA